MKFVEDKILKNGHVVDDDILLVDSFLNHQIDTNFALQVGEEFAKEFPQPTKILTIETSGLAFAFATSIYLNKVPVVFAKKSKSKLVDFSNVYIAQIKSFTRGTVSDVTVSKKYINSDDIILIVDDFLAEGNAATGLIDICHQAGAKVIGMCAVIEKSFQGGRKKIEDMGIKVVTGADVKAFENGKVVF